MAADRYVALNGTTGLLESKAGAVTNTPNAIVALDGAGKLAGSQMPTGFTDDVLLGVAISETIADGAFVELYAGGGGVLTVRNATAKGGALKEAKAFVVVGAGFPGVVDVHFTGANTAVTAGAGAITAGQPLYLDPDTTSGATGKVVGAPPAGPDYTQFLGFARAASLGGGATVSMGVYMNRPVGIV
jgi:hypothetical protein